MKIFLPDGSSKDYADETTLLDISKEFRQEFSSPIVAGMINGEQKDLQNKLFDGARVGFIEQASKMGTRVYAASLIMVFYTAMQKCLPSGCKLLIKSNFSNNIYCDVVSEVDLPSNYIEIIKSKMQEIIAKDERIVYQKVDRNVITKILEKQADCDRIGIVEQLDPEREQISIYSCEDIYAYFFSPMVPRSSCLKVFDVISYHGRILLRYPDEKNINKLEEFVAQSKLSETLKEAEQWGEIIGCRTITQLNKIIKKGETKSIIRIAEALHEKKIAQIADKIALLGNSIKTILIAGPSSSGKTTFAQRLKIQLQVNGINPIPISIDDYFLERVDAPRKANGDYDFESIHAIDLTLFNDHLKRLLAGETVEIPHFNFVSGRKEYRGQKIKLEKNQPLLLEGIHGLNDMLTEVVPLGQKLKVYISPLVQLRIDDHNLIERTEVRLLRRMVRDNRFRANDAKETIRQWQYVLEGEDENITPFQEKADIMFNTALIYEIAVLKKHAEPMLNKIDNNQAEYTIAKRLLNLLEYVESIEDDEIPPNSILREFIGDSWFH